MSTHGNDNIRNFKWKIFSIERLKSTRFSKKHYTLRALTIF